MEPKMIMDAGLFVKEPLHPPQQLNPLVLAYIGDAVFEMFIRQYVVSLPNQRPHVLHKRSSSYVSAKAQAKALKALQPHLSEEESDVVKRGRNAKSGSVPRNTDVIDYRLSTAFECLLGYLYYTHRYERLGQCMDLALQAINEERGLVQRED